MALGGCAAGVTSSDRRALGRPSGGHGSVEQGLEEAEAEGRAADQASSSRGSDRTVLTGFEKDAAQQAAPPRQAPEASKRLMIYSASFELLVSSVNDSLNAFLKKVEGLGGYLQSRENASVTCRVPADQFQKLVQEIPSLGVVVNQSMNALDVTKQYFDLSIRIETAEKSRQRLLVLLEKAEKVEDTLKIEQEVRRLTEEIDKLKGELKYLSEQIAYSTVDVLFRSMAPEPRPVGRRTHSRFGWINEVGVENVLERF